ncbi:MAG TPA: DUF2339 domain-containing protein [Gemmatimonadaceae bacterium]
MSDERRIEVLENIVRALTAEVRALRADVDRLAGARPAAGEAARAAPEPGGTASSAEPATRAVSPAAAPVLPPPTPPTARAAAPPGSAPRRPAAPAAARPRGTRGEMDVETLVGRYGAVAVAALTILMGVGAFVRWAIEHVRLGPEMRVLAGAIGAAAVAATGAWLRRRGHRRYGSILLALALAITHVVAWGAGPQLEVVSPPVALVIAALASAALALLAWRAEEELLFVVGVGGAFVAPFVTSSGEGSLPVLLAFGLLVFGGGAAGIRGRHWLVANVVLALAVSAYAATAFASGDRSTPLLALSPVLFALACAWLALALDERGALRGAVRGALLAAAVLAIPLAGIEPAAALRWSAVAGTLTAYARRLRVGHEPSGALVEGMVAPLLFLGAALASFADPTTPLGVAHALVWMAMAGAVAGLAGPGRRDVHLVVAALSGITAIVLALADRPSWLAPSLAAFGALVLFLALRLRAPLVLLPAAGAILLGTFRAIGPLVERPPYAYVPFLTIPSLVAAAVVALWVLAGLVARGEWRGADDEPMHVASSELAALLAAPRVWWAAAAVLALLWGREELAHAVSPDVANFLLIAYYAVAGVSAIAVGRVRSIAGARQAGLALAVYADLKAIFQAAQISSIGLRVGSYLLSGFFLLAVGYWAWTARSGEEEGAPDPSDAPAPAGDADAAPSGAR